MTEETAVLEIENPKFVIRVYENLIKIDLRGTLKNQVEEAVENKPVLKESIGKIFGIFVPLHIRIDEIKATSTDDTGQLTIKLQHRDVVLPFENKEDAKKLVEKLNQMISLAKDRARARIELSKARRKAQRKKIRKRPRAERRV